MAKYVCTLCGHVYDEDLGDPDSGIAPGTKWADVPADWTCPDCGADKDAFELQERSFPQTPYQTSQEAVP